MAYSNKSSWRLQFIDIDSSFVLANTASVVSGYMVARAPKGETRATYFGPGNAGAIDAMIGVGSADWPDILEAQSFNAEYGLYISAPAGTSEAYPSHYGGFYITRNGLFKFYNVQDKENPNYMANILPGQEDSFISGLQESKVVISSKLFGGNYVPTPEDGADYQWLTIDGTSDKAVASESGALVLTGIAQTLLNQMKRLDFDDPTGAYTTIETMADVLDSTKFIDENGNTVFLVSDNATGYGKDFELVRLMKGAKDQSGQYTTQFDVREFIGRTDDTISGEGMGPYILDEIIDNAAAGDVPRLVYEILTKGFIKFMSTKTQSEVIYSIPLTINGVFHELVDIQESTYVYFTQKSMTEKQTTIDISQIGYDAYNYDRVLPVFPDAFKNVGEYVFKSGDPEYVLFDYTQAPGGVTGQDAVYKVGALTTDASGTTYTYADANEEYATKIMAFGEQITIDSASKQINGSISLPKTNALYHTLWYCNGQNLKKLNTEEELIKSYGEVDGKKMYTTALVTSGDPTVATKAKSFNTLTVSSSEEVYAGSMTAGGSITGSLDEQGTDSYGANIYWPEMLSDDDFSFIEVRVKQKFGDTDGDMDNGFWTNKRVLDPYSMDQYEGSQQVLTFSIEGDRWATAVEQMNIASKALGCAWRDEWVAIIREGLIEAMSPDYDDSWILFECSGQETFKPDLFNIRIKHKLQTVISPKILTVSGNSNLFTDTMAQKVVVNSRLDGTALYAGEFLVYDATSKKKYYRMPIGDIACNLARIMDLRLGGAAPAWTNAYGGIGGQLKGVCIRAKYTFEDEATRTLDTKGINPISYTSDEGMMILSQKSTHDPANPSDWSYLGMSMSFDCVKREIRDNVMRPQVMKPINPYWMGIRSTQVQDILSKRTSGSDPVWTKATFDITGVNTALTKQAMNFVIKVAVTPTPFSETVTLIVDTLSPA